MRRGKLDILISKRSIIFKPPRNPFTFNLLRGLCILKLPRGSFYIKIAERDNAYFNRWERHHTKTIKRYIHIHNSKRELHIQIPERTIIFKPPKGSSIFKQSRGSFIFIANKAIAYQNAKRRIYFQSCWVGHHSKTSKRAVIFKLPKEPLHIKLRTG